MRTARFVGGPLDGQHREVVGTDIVFITERGVAYALRPDPYGPCDVVGVPMEGVL